MDKLPLQRKIEKAVTLLLQARQKAGNFLGGLNIVEGHTSEEPDMPWLSVYCADPKPAEDMPPETRIKEVRLTFHMKTQADDEALPDADGRLRELNDFFADPAAIIERLNPPASGADGRAVTELYIYAIFEADQPDSADHNNWHNQLHYDFTAQDWDPE